MNFTRIDIDKWERRECYQRFITIAKNSYSITVNMDITKLFNFLKENNFRLYPTFTWIVSTAVNNHIEFKMGYDKDGVLGYYDVVYPDYSVINDRTKNMDSLCTTYNNDFNVFHKNMSIDLNAYKENEIRSKKCENFFLVSCIPWLTYTSFSITNESNYPLLFPIITWGKYFEQGDKVLMPVTVQINHAVADGYHCALLYKDINQILQNPNEYLKD